MERKMAWIAQIDEIKDIPNADNIMAFRVGGWWIVDRKDAYKVGDLCVYASIDSWIPTQLAPFLTKGKEPREYNGVKGERLRTVKLRGQISQGLLLSVSCLTNYGADLEIGDDVSEVLNIQKWEAPVSAQLAGIVKGNFPTEIPKTDQERVQNLVKEIALKAEVDTLMEVSEKLEGSSMTVYRIRGEFGVCSRNLDLKRDENNSFWQVAIRDEIEQKMIDYADHWNFAIQGELIGPGVQGNIYNLTKLEFYVYDIYDVDKGFYLCPDDRRFVCSELGLKHVPVLSEEEDLGDADIDLILLSAEGKSMLNSKQEREGIVFKQIDENFSFKAISNRYLMKQG